MVNDEMLKTNINDGASSESVTNNLNKDNSSDLAIDKQLWLAKQQELSECEIIKRRKKDNGIGYGKIY